MNVGALGVEDQTGIQGTGLPLIGQSLGVIMAIGIVACLKFMWDVRRAGRSVG